MNDEKMRKEIQHLLKEADISIGTIFFEDVLSRLKDIRLQYPNGILKIQILVAINESEYFGDTVN